MRPLIFDFKEKPTNPAIDFSLVEYSNELNLTVVKNTQQPAIGILSMDTVTMTKAGEEGPDSDAGNITSSLRKLMDTTTQTMVKVETSDADPGRWNDLVKMMDTRTITESVESADSDK